MMLGSTSKVIGVYGVTISSLNGKFRLKTEVTKVECGILLSLDNPKYGEVLQEYTHLERVHMDDTKAELPIHIILRASDHAKIKTENKPKIGRPGECVGRLTQFGWTIMSPGKEVDLSNTFLTQMAATDYEKLCTLDVLGLPDKPSADQSDVYKEFKEQLIRSPTGWYETVLC